VILYAAMTAVWLSLLAGVSVPFRTTVILWLGLRVIAGASDPVLSDDVYRYLWDGRVSAAGINPYRSAPSDPQLAELREPWHGRINHPEIATIYPPLAQLLFAINGAIIGGLAGWRILLLLADLVSLILIRQRWGPKVAMAWAACPMVVIEGFWSGHVEIASVPLLLAALIAVGEGARGAFLAGAALIKVVPAIAIPALLARSPRPFRLGTAFSGVCVAVMAPFIAIGSVMPGMRAFAGRWIFNSPAYEIAALLVDRLSLTGHLRAGWVVVKDAFHLESISPSVYAMLYDDFIVRCILALMLFVAMVMVVRRSRGPADALVASMGALLLCSPVVHPWYWLALLPVALGERMHLWTALALAAPLSYLLYSGVERLPVYALCYAVPSLSVMIWRGAAARRARTPHSREAPSPAR
jgi:hypothetical protein